MGRALEESEARERARRSAELGAAIASTPEPLRASHTAETRKWEVTAEDGLPGTWAERCAGVARPGHRGLTSARR